MKKQQLIVGSWALSILVVLICIIAWGQNINWQFGKMNSYALFPLYGLLAYGLMWAHYISGAARKYLKIEKDALNTYFEYTSLAVLLCLLLHPGLLIWQLQRDGFGLPPGSYEAYVGKSLMWVAILGTISLLIFLAYELRRFYKNRSWWKYVQYGSDAAMLAVLYHALRLGSTLQSGWLKIIWYLLGLSYISALIYLYIPARKVKGE